MKLISGTANLPLSVKIAEYLNMELTKINFKKFADGEIFVKIEENLRGENVFLIQPTCSPTNHNIMEMLITIDAIRRASSRRITAVLPYYGYSRQDRKTEPHTPISAKLVATLLESVKIDRILTIDLHAPQIQGFFMIPVDNLYAYELFLKDIIKKFKNILHKEVLIVSPDIGGIGRARYLAKKLGIKIAIVDKRRTAPGQSDVMNIIGNVDNKICILVDDIVDSANSLINASKALMDKGAKKVISYVTHPVLTGKSIENIQNSQELSQLIVTDTIPLTKEALNCNKLSQITVAPLVGEAISRICSHASISSLFN